VISHSASTDPRAAPGIEIFAAANSDGRENGTRTLTSTLT
jgi:hypothetical protein